MIVCGGRPEREVALLRLISVHHVGRDDATVGGHIDRCTAFGPESGLKAFQLIGQIGAHHDQHLVAGRIVNVGRCRRMAAQHGQTLLFVDNAAAVELDVQEFR